MRLPACFLLLLALAPPAHAQDGPHDAATARDAAQALQLYLDAASTAGRQPDFTKPPAADLFRHVFDRAELKRLPPPAAGDLNWMLTWGAAADQSYKLILLFGLKPGANVDQLALRRNMTEYEDQYAAAMDFMVRFQARLMSATSLFVAQLPPDQRTPARAAGLQQARIGAAQMILGAIVAMTNGMKPANVRLITAAMQDTKDVWATYIPPDDRGHIVDMLKKFPAAVQDRAAQKSVASFAGALAAAK